MNAEYTIKWAFVLELQHLVEHLVPHQGDRHPEPGGGRGGREVQDGGAGGLKTNTVSELF